MMVTNNKGVNMEQAKRNVGGVWKGTTKKGEDYLYIVLEGKDGRKFRYYAFVNQFKESDKQPDFNIFLPNKKD